MYRVCAFVHIVKMFAECFKQHSFQISVYNFFFFFFKKIEETSAGEDSYRTKDMIYLIR